jgi:hypothetical protein
VLQMLLGWLVALAVLLLLLLCMMNVQLML